MFWMQGKWTQEVGVSKKEREKKRGSGTSAKCMGENKMALWGKGATSKRSGHEHGGVDNAMGISNPCKV